MTEAGIRTATPLPHFSTLALTAASHVDAVCHA
jgi:hypothetical protein